MVGRLRYVGLRQRKRKTILQHIFFKKLFLQVSLYLNGNKAQIKNKAEIRMMKDDFRDSRG